jgi:hypothetical protein
MMPVNQAAGQLLELERRSNTRYPVELNVRYRTLANGRPVLGMGRTLNASSRGLLIASGQQIVHYGSLLQVSLEWPLLLDGTTPLQLIAVCRVIRCQPAGFAVRLQRYQFRTQKPGLPPIP